jgi:hypothetical protein
MATEIKRLDILIIVVIVMTPIINFVFIMHQVTHLMFYMGLKFIFTKWPHKVNAIIHTFFKQYLLCNEGVDAKHLGTWYNHSDIPSPGVEGRSNFSAILLASGRKNQKSSPPGGVSFS